MTTRTDGPDDDVRARPVAPEPRRRGVRAVAGLTLAAVVVGALVVLTGRAVDLLPSWGNPFREEVTESSTAPLMLALDDLSEYHAATGTFQVVVEQERDRRYVPSFVSGERTTLLATGSVDAVVDLSGLDEDQVRVSPDRRAVAFSVPAPRLDAVTVDLGESRVLDRDRGAVERVSGMFQENPSRDGELYTLAERELAAAASESDLLLRAEVNSRDMLTTLARSLGFEQVTVTFEAPPT